MSDEQPKRKARGPGKKPSIAMTHINLRLPADVVEYYKQRYPSYTTGMRDVLTEWAKGIKKCSCN